MNDVNLDGATLRLVKPGTTIPKDTEILLDIGEDLMYFRFGYERTTLDTGKTYLVERDQKPTVAFGSIRTQKFSSDPLTVSGSLTSGHVQVPVKPDPTYTAKFILDPDYRGEVTITELSGDAILEIANGLEHEEQILWVPSGDGTEHIIPTANIYRIIITKETA